MGVFKSDIYAGKVIFVTGGGTGICYGITKAMMEHGANAVILGRRKHIIEEAAKKLEKETGKKCIGLSGDVRKVESLKEAVKKAVDTFGRIDFVVCGAAGNFLSPLSGMSENAFKTVIDIDTLGTYNTFKATIDEVVKTKGTYLAVSATLHYRGTALQAHVSAAKAAVDALMKVIAVEYGPVGVRSNIIAPGPISNTEGINRLIPVEQAQRAEELIPLQRMGSIENIADAALFLFSEAASLITGTTLVVDGGQLHTSSTGPLYPKAFNDPNFRSNISKLLGSKL